MSLRQDVFPANAAIVGVSDRETNSQKNGVIFFDKQKGEIARWILKTAGNRVSISATLMPC